MWLDSNMERSLDGALNLPRDRNVRVISPARMHPGKDVSRKTRSWAVGRDAYMGGVKAIVKAHLQRQDFFVERRATRPSRNSFTH
jgi:hypothetical protein